MSTEFSPDVTILAPKIDNPGRFDLRYGGLAKELIDVHELEVGLADSHDSYDPKADVFKEAYALGYTHEEVLIRQGIGDLSVRGVIRDLTMPQQDAKPIYAAAVKAFVNPPELNAFLRRKAQVYSVLADLQPTTRVTVGLNRTLDVVEDTPWRQVIIKPNIGSESERIIVGDKKTVSEELGRTNLTEDDSWLVQEYLDTSVGIPELGIEGIHNLRIISIGGLAIFAVARLETKDPQIIRNDEYGRFYSPDAIPNSMQALVDQTHRKLRAMPEAENSVFAIDLMRGVDEDGEQRDVVCEVNRRPLRISAYDLLEPVADEEGLRRAARAWDKAEAELLARVAAA